MYCIASNVSIGSYVITPGAGEVSIYDFGSLVRGPQGIDIGMFSIVDADYIAVHCLCSVADTYSTGTAKILFYQKWFMDDGNKEVVTAHRANATANPSQNGLPTVAGTGYTFWLQRPGTISSGQPPICLSNLKIYIDSSTLAATSMEYALSYSAFSFNR